MVQAETQEQLQSAQTQLQEDDGSARPQVQQEQRGSLVQEGIWVIDLTVDDPTATKDGGDTYMVSAALVASATTCTCFADLTASDSKGIMEIPCRKARWPEVLLTSSM